MTQEPQHRIETDVSDSNPNAAGPRGLEGDMGISSERTGPLGDQDAADKGIQGTGTVGSAVDSTEGTMSTEDTERRHAEDPAEGADGPEMDDTQQEATQEWRDGQPAATPEADSGDADSGTEFSTGIDRTVGEDNTAEVPSQTNDPSRNPGHSHG